MRSAELRAQSGPVPRDCRPDQCEEGQCVRSILFDFLLVCCLTTNQTYRPREAAVALVQYVNHRNPNVSLLALSVCCLAPSCLACPLPACNLLTWHYQLLDICVKNCGYAFHLQVSTKEFLNELVRRFPERPPIRATRVQNRILELIEEWRSTICQTSKYKEDLGFIRDMHRLLSYKGYTFPAVKKEDAAVLNPSDV